MRIRAGFVSYALTLGVALLQSTVAGAQPVGGGSTAYPVQQAGGPAQAAPFMVGGPGGHYVDAYGNPAILPASYSPHGGGGGYGYGGYGYGEMPDLFGGAHAHPEQTGPHYFDISGEAIYWKRNDLGGSVVPFTAQGTSLNPTITNIVQTSDSLGSGYEPGFRLFGRYDIGALSVIEVGYTGLLNQTSASRVEATSFDATGLQGNLFSPFTNFAVSFLDAGNTQVNPFAGGVIVPDDLDVFEETDRATSHSLKFDSNLQTAEINYRRYWVGYSPRLTGTLLAGFRYTRLDEELSYVTTGADFAVGAPAGTVPTAISRATYRVNADNDLAGFQLGGDASYAIRQGIRLQTEGKVGLFNNDISVATTFSTLDGTPTPFSEVLHEQQVAFITDARVTLIIDVLPSVSLKAGYEVLFLNSIATSIDNVDFTGIPAGVADVPPRSAMLDDQSDALFHGGHLGLEYVW